MAIIKEPGEMSNADLLTSLLVNAKGGEIVANGANA
jgi:hypothetical protein